ncbi:DUF4145 domain-containing protein [Micromonospora sp. WMMD735]|uniref:DUF4145 domain-containing protein n=1 Tax=Micromonospora sp. WMMD735 TaxID=3404130 RepID=UPI003B95DBAE
MSGNETVAIICPNCAKPSAAVVVGRRKHDVADGVASFLWCDECDNGLVVWQELDLYFDARKGDYDLRLGTPHVWWPEVDRPLSAAIPQDLRDTHLEARKCFHATAYSATAAMVRKTIEMMCGDQGLSRGRLVDRLQKLSERGIVDARMVEWMQSLRSLGNNAVHAGGSVAKADARDALDLAEAILDYVYVFAKKFKDFEARQAVQSGHGPGAPIEVSELRPSRDEAEATQ